MNYELTILKNKLGQSCAKLKVSLIGCLYVFILLLSSFCQAQPQLQFSLAVLDLIPFLDKIKSFGVDFVLAMICKLDTLFQISLLIRLPSHGLIDWRVIALLAPVLTLGKYSF